MSNNIINLDKARKHKQLEEDPQLEQNVITYIEQWLDNLVYEPEGHPSMVMSSISEGTTDFIPDRAFMIVADGDNVMCLYSTEYSHVVNTFFQMEEEGEDNE